MTRRVVITGLGTVTAAGMGIDPLWEAVCAGRSALGPIQAFDPAGFAVRMAGEVPAFKVNKIVPKSYRKATKVMARDIELAVAAADGGVRDAGLNTPGLGEEGEPTYAGPRLGAHIGAGLIAADADELTGALRESRDGDGRFDIHHWGREGMNNLTPLWLLKYLPNMLACHVTILHDAQGPSNTITCGEASGGLSVAESARVIFRDKADACFCGGAESKLNLMAFYRQVLTGRLSERNDEPTAAVRPFDSGATGTVIGEGAGIVLIESHETATQRGAKMYAELIGFGASQSLNPQKSGLEPEPDGRGIAGAIRQSLRAAELEAGDIDAVVGFGSGIPAYDRAEAAAYRAVFGDRAADVPLWSSKPFIGNCGAADGGIDIALAAKMLTEQTLPATVNCDDPLDGLNCGTQPSRTREMNHVLVVGTSMGGQNVAAVLRRITD